MLSFDLVHQLSQSLIDVCGVMDELADNSSSLSLFFVVTYRVPLWYDIVRLVSIPTEGCNMSTHHNKGVQSEVERLLTRE